MNNLTPKQCSNPTVALVQTPKVDLISPNTGPCRMHGPQTQQNTLQTAANFIPTSGASNPKTGSSVFRIWVYSFWGLGFAGIYYLCTGSYYYSLGLSVSLSIYIYIYIIYIHIQICTDRHIYTYIYIRIYIYIYVYVSVCCMGDGNLRCR